MKQPRSNRAFGVGTQYLAAAMRFAGAVVLFLFGGLWLDGRLHTTPLFTLAGALLGAGLGFFSVYREYRADADKNPMRSWSDKRRR